MDEQNRYEGFSPTAYGAPVPYAAPPELYAAPQPPQLRPLSTGEVLDRTFALYRRKFWLFVGIGMVPAAVVALTSMARMIYLASTHRADMIQPGATPDALAKVMSNALLLQIYFLPATLLFVVAYGVSHAATVTAVGRVTQGLGITAGEALRETRSRWLRWTGIALRQFWSFLWPLVLPVALIFTAVAIPSVRGNAVAIGIFGLVSALLLPGAFVFGCINMLRNALAMPAGVQEGLGVNAAMRRSKALVAGRKGRVFLTLLLVYALQVVAGGLQLPFVLLATTTRGAEHIILQAIDLMVAFVATALVTPIASIALTLIYVDERVRREGYDIELLMHHSFAGTAKDVAIPVSPDAVA